MSTIAPADYKLYRPIKSPMHSASVKPNQTPQGAAEPWPDGDFRGISSSDIPEIQQDITNQGRWVQKHN